MRVQSRAFGFVGSFSSSLFETHVGHRSGVRLGEYGIVFLEEEVGALGISMAGLLLVCWLFFSPPAPVCPE